MKELVYKKYKIICLLFLCSQLLFSCKQKRENITSNDVQFEASFDKIVSDIESDSIKENQLARLLDSINKISTESNHITDRIYEYLYYQWEANPESFSHSPSIFSQASTNKNLSSHIRISASLFLSLTYYIQYNIPKMDSLLSEIAIHENEMDDVNKILYYRNIGLQLNIKNKSQEATTVFQKALDLVKRNPNYNNCELGNIFCNYASVYLKLNDNKRALELLKKAYLLLSETQCNSNDLQATILNIAVAYSNLHNNDSAIWYNKQELSLITQVSRKNYMMCFISYLNIGGEYVEIKKYDSARVYFDKASSIKNKINNDNLVILLNIFSAVADAPIKDVCKNVEQIKEYVTLFYKNNDLYDVQNAYEALSKIAVIKNDYKEGLFYIEKLDSIKELVTSTENKKMVGELEAKYQGAQKDLEINKQQTQIRQSHNLSYFLIACMTILALVTILSIKSVKTKKEREAEKMRENFTNQLLEGNESERERIASELHDNINQRLVLLKKEMMFISPISAIKVEEIINNIRNIARNLFPVSLPHIGLQYSIEHLCEEMSKHHHLSITSEISFNEYILDKNTELHLFRLVQEALNNIIKHAQATTAKVTINEDEQKRILRLEVRDNGSGFDVEASLKSKNSFGLHSILQRSKAIKGDLNINSNNNGTIISINLPYSS